MKWSEGLSKRASTISRIYIYISYEVCCIYGCFVYQILLVPFFNYCIYGCMFFMHLFNFVNYVFLLYVYIFLLLYIFCSGYSV